MKLSFLAFLFLLVSCKKERSCEGCDTETGFKEATIVFTGPIEADGCDWMVKIGDDQYVHPDMLDAKFKQNGLAVKICCEITTAQFRCGIAAQALPVIHILRIEKQ